MFGRKEHYIGIPDEALGYHTIILGKTRAGKSSTARLMVERLLDDGNPVCIVDPKGDWWGIKSSADGKSAGYPLVIFGGKHADVPLNSRSGKEVAELVATGNRPCIIDLKGWKVSERAQFFIDFAHGMFVHTNTPRHLVIDEVHNFAPQGAVLSPQNGEMLHWANRLASEGAGMGITLFSMSQRPQKVHKDYITCHETLIAMRAIHPRDRAAAKEWIDGCPDLEKGKEVLESLASMKRGEGWAWCPEIDFGPILIKFPLFRTYDSFAAPKGKAVEKLEGWADVNLDEVKEKLAAAVEDAKANDPRHLKARIRELEGELAANCRADGGQIDPAMLEEVQEAAREEGYAQGVSAAWAGIHETVSAQLSPTIENALECVSETQSRLTGLLAALKAGEAITAPDAPAPKPAREVAPPRNPNAYPPKPVQRAPAAPQAANTGDLTLTGPQLKLLEALAWWKAMGHDAPTRPQVAGIAGWKITSGHLKNVIGSLKTSGLVEYPTSGQVAMTEAGIAAAPTPDMSASLHDGIRAALTGPQTQIFNVLLERHGASMTRDEVAAACGWEPTSGHLKNVIGSLKTLQVIEYPRQGEVALQAWVLE